MDMNANSSIVAAAFSSLFGIVSTNYFGSPVIVDVLKLYSCAIPRISTKELSVRMVGNKTIILEAYLSNTIEEIKMKIRDQIGIALEEQQLSFRRKDLNDKSTLKDYGIQNGSLLHLSLLDGMKIFVKTVSGKVMTFDVEPNETIDDVKYMIEELEGIPPNTQFLFFAGKEARNGHTLADYNIANESTLYLDPQPIPIYADLYQKPTHWKNHLFVCLTISHDF
jgi:hypothetical protein